MDTLTIIAPSTINSPWNSALLIAPKKDIGGNRTGWRVCIDPRHINLLIPDANFPLPLIREILEKLAGAVTLFVKHLFANPKTITFSSNTILQL
jgi:hypothetical protein